MTLRDFRDVLKRISGVTIYHNKALKPDGDYIVWHEVGNVLFNADNAVAEVGTRIAVDFYTKQEYSGKNAEMLSILSSCDEICVSDTAIDYEDTTGFTHYAYTVEVV